MFELRPLILPYKLEKPKQYFIQKQYSVDDSLTLNLMMLVKQNQTAFTRPKTERLHSSQNKCQQDMFYCKGKSTTRQKPKAYCTTKSFEQSAIQKIIRSITQKQHTTQTYTCSTHQSTSASTYRSPPQKFNNYTRANSPILANNSKIIKQRCASQVSLQRSPQSVQRIRSPQVRSQAQKSFEQIALKQYFSVRTEKKSEQFNYLAVLGQGKFGKVYLAQHKSTRQIFAMKTIKKSQLKESSLDHQFQREVSIQKALKHRNILRLFDVFEDDTLYYLQMEHAKEGSLFQYIVKQPQKYVSEREAAKMIQQVVKAVKYMHQNDVIHRDLKPENILLCENNVIKVSDFGWSVKLDKQERETLCGTLEYLSPEMINRESYDFSIDIWSIGVLIFEICSGKTPFANPTFCDLTDLQFPGHMSNTVCDLIRHILVNRKNRKSLDWILRHKWFSS